MKKYRSKLGLTQEELAWRSDMHRTYLADIERGARNLRSIENLAHALQLSVEGLLLHACLADAPPTCSDLVFAPGVVLLVMRLPWIDGLEVLRRNKADPLMRTIPTVVLTSSPEQRDGVESYRMGVNSCILKPVNFDRGAEAVCDLGAYCWS